MTKAVVLLSGGLDSSTALAMARDRGRECLALSLYYGQRHEIEIESAATIAWGYQSKHIVREVSIPKGDSLLMHHNEPMVQGSYAEISGVSPTFVPNRNAIFISLAASLALATKYDEVWFAAHADDAENWAYPDCTPEFVGAMAAATYVGSYHKVRLVAPFLHMTKADIVTLGHQLDVPYKLTRSCYTNGFIHCGTCPTCISRKDAFRDAGVLDPTDYKE